MSNKNRNSSTRRSNTVLSSGLSCLSDARGAEALRQLRSTRAPGRPPFFDNILGDLDRHGEEGVDHINVSNTSRTEVGRIFSLLDNMPYYDSVLETNISALRVFTHFLKTGMSEPRFLVPNAMEPNTKIREHYAANSLAFQAHAIWEKIKHVPALQELLTSLAVPLDWYLTGEGGVRRRLISGSGYAAALVVIQKALRDGEAPDFTPFFDLEVQQQLRRLDRSDRLIEVNRLLMEELIPLRDAIKAVKSEQARARELRRQQRAAEQKAAAPAADPAKPAGDKRKKDRNRGQQKPRGIKPENSLNHMVPTVHEHLPEAASQEVAPVAEAIAPAPVAPAAAVPQGGSMTIQNAAGQVELPADALGGLAATPDVLETVAQVAEQSGAEVATA